MQFNFRYVKSLYEDDRRPENEEVFRRLVAKWKEREAETIASMEGVTGLKFQTNFETMVYERPQDMPSPHVPAYMSHANHVQTFLMREHEFVAMQIHEKFHELLDQRKIKEYKRGLLLRYNTTPLVAEHVIVHAGLREVVREVHGEGDYAKRIVDGNCWWNYVPKDGEFYRKHGEDYRKSWELSSDSAAIMKGLRDYVKRMNTIRSR